MSELLSLENVFEVNEFVFPFKYRFSGQQSEEKILYIAREAKIMLYLRQIGAMLVGIVALVVIALLNRMLDDLGVKAKLILGAIGVLVIIITLLILSWLRFTWKRTLGIVTNYHLIKLIQINPINNIRQTLPVKNIVDTQSQTRTPMDRILGVGSFEARSGANSSGVSTEDAQKGIERVNKKSFYFIRIKNAEDLENYVKKLMNMVSKHSDEKMQTFRPFIADAKTGQRQSFIDQYPEYWG